jgi:hypothetical protein
MNIGLSFFSKYRSIIGLDIEMTGAIEEIDRVLYSTRVCSLTIGVLFFYIECSFKIGRGEKLNIDLDNLKEKLKKIKENEEELNNIL